MSCCGGKRAALAAGTAYARAQRNLYAAEPARQPAAQREIDARAGSLLSYTGQGGISLRGPVSGQVYVFQAGTGTVRVLESDLDALIRTGLFVRAG